MRIARWIVAAICAGIVVQMFIVPARARVLTVASVGSTGFAPDSVPTVAAAAAVPPGGTTVVTTYSDGDFNNGTWSSATVYAVNAAGITETENYPVPTGGNPGAYYRFSGVMPTFNGTNSVLRTAHFTPSAVFNPATQGAITNISGGLQWGAFQNYNGGTFEVGLALRQDGKVYAPTELWGAGFGTPAGWYGSNQLYQNYGNRQYWALQEVSPPGLSYPDFSAAGTPIEFGFLTGYYFENPYQQAINYDGVDNWTVTVASTVPEPAAMTLVAGGVLGMVALTARRKHC